MKTHKGHSMNKLLLSVSFITSLATALGPAQADAQTADAGVQTTEAGAPMPEAGTQPMPSGVSAPSASDVEAQLSAELSALQSQTASGGYANDQGEHHRLDFYGFADFAYWRMLGDSPAITASTSTFSVGNLNLYMASELGDEWRSLIEVRFMYLPNGGQPNPTGIGKTTDTTVMDINDFGRPIQWGGIHIERAWLERTFHKLLTVRVGHWLTPYGIWNVDHGSPVVIGVGRPFIVGEALFPSSQTGIELYGTTDFNSVQLGYHLTLSNGRGPSSTTMDLDDNKAIGGRLFLRYESALGTVNLGTAVYRGQYSNKHSELGVVGNGTPTTVTVIDSQYDELSLSVDLKWQWRGLLVQGEAIENEVAYTASGRTVSTSLGAPAFDSDYRRWGAYGLAGYRFSFLGVMPYGSAGYYKEGSPSMIPELWYFLVGLNVRPTPRVVLKLQYDYVHFYLDIPSPNEKMLTAQTAWSF
jgi:hypothetical protein